MNIDDITFGEAKQLVSMFSQSVSKSENKQSHPVFGRRCIVRTYSAGVHIGTVSWINPYNSMECKLVDGLRLWKWEGGGLSLSVVAEKGIVKGRLNREAEIFLTNVIEYLPTTKEAEATYAKFIED